VSERVTLFIRPSRGAKAKGEVFTGPTTSGKSRSLRKYFCMYHKTDHLNWAYVNRQLLCDFSTNLSIPGMDGWMDGCMYDVYHAFGVKFLQLFFITDARSYSKRFWS